jgi:hypothetical protein
MTKRMMRASLCAAFGLALLVGSAGNHVRAAEAEEDDPWDAKIFKGVLSTLGLRQQEGSGIEYRERSPLVVPPSRNLPTPQAGGVENPAWPVDQEAKRRKDAAASARRREVLSGDKDDRESRPLLPSQLSGGRASGAPVASRGNQGPGETGDDTAGRPLAPSKLGQGNIFRSMFSSFGQNEEEHGTFTREPPRANLTQPPAGYQTPSANQPYGVGKERHQMKPMNPMDKATEQ